MIHQTAQTTASALPGLLIEAQRIADTVIHGVHGRRRAGPGEDFWQYRPYTTGDAAARIDWRRSAKRNRLFVRENEWAATNTLWSFVANTPGMDYKSDLSPVTKHHRAAVLATALSILAIKAGERIAGIGAPMNPGHTRTKLRQLVHWYETTNTAASLPANQSLPRFATMVLLGDFLDPIDQIKQSFQSLAANGAKGHVVMVLDPSEESFPFTGRTRFLDTASGNKIMAGKAQTLRADYVKKLDSHRAAIIDLTNSLGWHFTLHHTDKPASTALFQLYHLIAGQAPSAHSAMAGG